MYFLASTIYKKQKTTSFIASIFYMFNFVVYLSVFNDGICWVLVFLPLLLTFWIRVTENVKLRQSTIKNVIGVAIISSVLMSFATINPALVVLVLTTIFTMFIYSILSMKGFRVKITKTMFFLSAVCVATNVWWAIPFIGQVISYTNGTSQLATVTNVTSWQFVFARSSFLNLFRLNGIWSWTPDYSNYTNIYSNSFLIILGFVPIILAFLGLLFKSKYQKINLTFAAAILGLMFLAKGLAPPFSNVNLFLYNNVPGFFLFRDPFLKFFMILLIPLALLIGSSCESIIERIINQKIRFFFQFNDIKIHLSPKLFATIIICIFLIGVFPLFTMPFQSNETQALPFSTYVNIPSYWYQASNYINDQKGDFKVLLTPADDYYQMPYTWGYYGTDALGSSLIDKPVIFQVSGGYTTTSDIVSIIFKRIEDNDSVGFVTLVSSLNIKYILQRNDIWYNFTGRSIISPDDMKAFLSNIPGITRKASFGKLDLYQVSDNQSLPKIYPSTSSLVINDSTDELSHVLSNSTLNLNGNSFFLSSQLNPSQLQFVDNLSTTGFIEKSEPLLFLKMAQLFRLTGIT